MKKRMAGMILFGLCVILAGCGGTGRRGRDMDASRDEKMAVEYPRITIVETNDYIEQVIPAEGRYLIVAGEKCGYMSKSGEEITPFLYDVAYPFHEGLACVSYEGKYGFIDLDGETAIPFVYDRATPFSEGLAYFVDGETYGFMNKTGESVFYLNCDSVSSFQEGMAYFSIDGKYGYIDKEGETAIQPIYEDAGYFKDGLAMVRKDNRVGMIDKEGEVIIDIKYDRVIIEDNYILGVLDGKYDCFNKNGRKLLEDSYEYVWVSWMDDGYFFFGDYAKHGLATAEGEIIFEPEYDYMTLVPGQEMVIAGDGEYYGVLDMNGQIKIPFIYDYISYDDGVDGGAWKVEKGDKCGYLNADDFTTMIPMSFDDIRHFVNGRAVYRMDDKYGVIDSEGITEILPRYDFIQLFEDGAYVLETDSCIQLYDKEDELLKEIIYDENDDECGIYEYNECYKYVVDGKIGFLNKAGEEVVPPTYAYMWDGEVYGASSVYLLEPSFDEEGPSAVVQTGAAEASDISDAILRNELTPRARLFMEAVWDAEGESAIENEVYTWYREFYKLYDLDGSGNLVLYYCAKPYERPNFPLSDSGFYGIVEGEITPLVEAYECGGSMRGDTVCFWYDAEVNEIRLGTDGVWGGFGGYSSTHDMYEYKDGKLTELITFNFVNQVSGNYEEEDLLEDAELFYDEDGNTYTADNILEADSVSEYRVDDVRVIEEFYAQESERYRYMEPIE